jgi:hypothetical protein
VTVKDVANIQFGIVFVAPAWKRVGVVDIAKLEPSERA